MKKTGLVLLLAVLPTRAFCSFALDFPVVTHTQGSSTTFFTSLDVTNYTITSTDVHFEYIANDLSVDAFGTLTTLAPHGNFHTDDLLPYLASKGFMTTAQANSGFGTLLIGFTNASFTNGNEASATVRIYNYVNNGQKPSVGLAYRGQLLRLNGLHALSSVMNNTSALTDNTPSLITNMGLENVGIDDNGTTINEVVTLHLTFYDPRNGNTVGSASDVTLGPGQMMQINDVWKSANLPADATTLIVQVAETKGTSQIRGYTVVKDTNTNDGSFYFMEQ